MTYTHMVSWVEAGRLKGSDAGDDSERLLRRARAGDREALAALVHDHVNLVRRLITRVLGERQDLDDLVQNTFVETLNALPRFRGESALSTFIAGIAIRVARRAARPTRVVAGRTTLDDEPVSATPCLHEQVESREVIARARRALSRVAEPKRVAFLLWALEGMNLEEIAQVMDASVAATRSRVYYAQKELHARAARDPVLREWLEEPSS